jgi:hypothetical protein
VRGVYRGDARARNVMPCVGGAVPRRPRRRSAGAALVSRKLRWGVRGMAMAARAYFWCGGTEFTRFVPYARLGSFASLVRRRSTRPSLTNIRYKQRLLTQNLHVSLVQLGFTLSPLINRTRMRRLAGHLGRGNLLALAAARLRPLLQSSKLALDGAAALRLVCGGFVFVRGRAQPSLNAAAGVGACVQLALNAAYLAYLAAGWLRLRARLRRARTARSQRIARRYLYLLDDAAQLLEVDYGALTLFGLPWRGAPQGGAWTLLQCLR